MYVQIITMAVNLPNVLYSDTTRYQTRGDLWLVKKRKRPFQKIRDISLIFAVSI